MHPLQSICKCSMLVKLQPPNPGHSVSRGGSGQDAGQRGDVPENPERVATLFAAHFASHIFLYLHLIQHSLRLSVDSEQSSFLLHKYIYFSIPPPSLIALLCASSFLRTLPLPRPANTHLNQPTLPQQSTANLSLNSASKACRIFRSYSFQILHLQTLPFLYDTCAYPAVAYIPTVCVASVMAPPASS